MRVGEQLLGFLAAAHDVPAESVFALRREADVRHHRDAGAHDPLDLLRAAHPAFELDGVGTGLLHETDRVASASSGPFSYEPNGMSAMTNARFAPRTTAPVRGISSSTVTGIVVS